MQLEPGTNLSERLRLVRPIGAGGMGSVWVAENVALGMNVAVKVLADKYVDDEEALARFRREARTLARIANEHVVRIYDFAALPGGIPYMVLELLDGEDLEKRIGRMGRLSVGETAGVLSQALAALSKIHASGIVHRDMKPDNIFVSEWNGHLHIKIFDFGIAKVDTPNVALTTTGATMGTPLYMSPEQVMGAKSVDHRCDLWSMAVVAYHCLTGRVPFDGDTYGALCVSIHKAKLMAPSALRPELPPAIDAWFEKALKRDIRHRFQTADEMREAFLDACEQVSERPRTVVARPANRGSTDTLTGSAVSAPAANSNGRRLPWVVAAVGVAAATAFFFDYPARWLRPTAIVGAAASTIEAEPGNATAQTPAVPRAVRVDGLHARVVRRTASLRRVEGSPSIEFSPAPTSLGGAPRAAEPADVQTYYGITLPSSQTAP